MPISGSVSIVVTVILILLAAAITFIIVGWKFYNMSKRTHIKIERADSIEICQSCGDIQKGEGMYIESEESKT